MFLAIPSRDDSRLSPWHQSHILRLATNITMASKSYIKVGDQHLQVDPQLLFQRLIISSRSVDNKEEAFVYELCSYPPALFYKNQMIREPQISVLADALCDQVPALSDTTKPTSDMQYVLDGVALLHRIPRPRGSPTVQRIIPPVLQLCDS